MAKNNKPKIIDKRPSKIGKILVGAATALALAYATFQLYNSQPITLQELKSYQGVEEIISYKGDTPQNIVVLQIHPNQNTQPQKVVQKKMNSEPVFKIFDNLYKRRMRDLIIEGLRPEDVEYYNKHKKIFLNKKNKGEEELQYMISLEHLLNSHSWRLHAGENNENRTSRQELLMPLNTLEKKIISDLDSSMKSIFGVYRGATITKQEETMLNEKYIALIAEINLKISNAVTSFFTPQNYTNLYNLTFTERDRQFTSVIHGIGKQTAILIGYGHALTITNELKESYAIVKPDGIADELMPFTLENLRDSYLFKIDAYPIDYILKKEKIKVAKK